MSDWILLDEALVRVSRRMGLIVEGSARGMLIRALRDGLVETHQGPSDPLTLATDSWIISVPSLNAWIDDMLDIGPKVVAKPHFVQDDEPPKAASAQRAAAQRAVAELWGGLVPAGLTVDRRNAQIQQFAREKGLAPPSDKTLQRFFTSLSKVARVGRS